MYVSYDKNKVMVAASDHPITIQGHSSEPSSLSQAECQDNMGKRVKTTVCKPHSELRVAIICNWNVPCGISTYTKFLVDALRPLVAEIKIFSEVGEPMTPDTPDVSRCWERGKPMRQAITSVMEFKPDFVIVQHEYGIFPNACHFLQMLHMLE